MRSPPSSTTCCPDRRQPHTSTKVTPITMRRALPVRLRRRHARLELRLAHARAHDAHDADHQDQHQAEQARAQSLLHGGRARSQRRNRNRQLAFALARRRPARAPARSRTPSSTGCRCRIADRPWSVARCPAWERTWLPALAAAAERRAPREHRCDVLRTSTSATPGITTGGRIVTSRRYGPGVAFVEHVGAADVREGDRRSNEK